MQSQEPGMPEQVAQSLDPALVGRLRRPVERPGVIDPGLARAMFARHQRMATGWPLADLVARHTGSTLDPAGTVPIVYVLPAQPPPAPDSLPRQTPSAPAGSGPIVTGRPARPHAPGAVPAAHEAPPTLVVQRKIDVQAPPVSRIPPDLASPELAPRDLAPRDLWAPAGRPPADRLSADRLSAGRLPADRLSAGRLPADRLSENGPVGATAPDPTPLRPGMSAAASAPPVVFAAPGGAPTAARAAVGGTPIGTPPSTPLPLVQLSTGSRHNTGTGHHVHGGAVPLVVAAAPTPWPSAENSARATPHGPADLARPAPANSVNRPLPSLREPLLLVGLAAATSRSTQDSPGTAERRDLVAGRPGRPPVAGRPDRPPGAGEAAPAVPSAGGAARPHRPSAAEVDVEHIVDTVHRRFVRRLAVEAERRAVR